MSLSPHFALACSHSIDSYYVEDNLNIAHINPRDSRQFVRLIHMPKDLTHISTHIFPRLAYA